MSKWGSWKRYFSSLPIISILEQSLPRKHTCNAGLKEMLACLEVKKNAERILWNHRNQKLKEISRDSSWHAWLGRQSRKSTSNHIAWLLENMWRHRRDFRMLLSFVTSCMQSNVTEEGRNRSRWLTLWKTTTKTSNSQQEPTTDDADVTVSKNRTLKSSL